MSRKILALDIQTGGISALLIVNSLKGNWISAHKHVPLKGAADEAADSETSLAGGIKAVMDEIDPSGAEILVSIPPEWISFRNLKTPFKDRKKIRQVLPFEMEPTLPYPIDGVAMDFLTIQQGDRTDIFAAAVETEKLNEMQEALKSCNVDPRMVTCGGLPAAICLTRLSESVKDFFFIDLDGKNATIFVSVSGRVYTARSFQYGSGEPAKKASRLYSGILQIKASFETSFNIDFEPSFVQLSGNGTDDESLVEALEQMLGMPVRHAYMLKDLDLSIRPPDLAGFKPDRMINPLCLAAIEILGIRSINFCGERSVLMRYWEEYKNDIVKTGFIAGCVFIIVMFNVLVNAYFLQKNINYLNRRIAFIFQSTFPDVTKIVDPVQQMQIKIQQLKEKNTFAGEMENEKLNIDILNEMSERIPEDMDVEITRFVRGDNSILISGNTDTFNAVDEIKGRLEKSNLLGKVTISSANQDKTTNRIQFKLKVEI